MDYVSALFILCQVYGERPLPKAAGTAKPTWWRRPFGRISRETLLDAIAPRFGANREVPAEVATLIDWMFLSSRQSGPDLPGTYAARAYSTLVSARR